jgi:hypothetical protein
MKSMVAKKSILHVPGGAKLSLLVPPPHPVTVGANDIYALDGQYVCIHLPEAMRTHDGPMRLLVVVHGYSASQNSAKGRQAVRRFASFWGQRVTEYKWAVMAPHFDEKRFQKDYQRLNRFGLRTDVSLNQLVDDAALLIPGLETENCLGKTRTRGQLVSGAKTDGRQGAYSIPQPAADFKTYGASHQ